MEVLPDAGIPREAIGWFPTVAGEPIASSALIAAGPPATGECRIQPWKITVLALSPSSTEALLTSCGAKELAGETLLQPGVVMGQDLLFWAHALRFAASLVTRQQFLPGLVATPDGFSGQWIPVIAEDDIGRSAALAQAMPSVARAFSARSAAEPMTSQQTVLSAFLQATVDFMVRTAAASRLTSLPLESVHDRWLHALRSADGGLLPDEPQVRKLAEQVREWRRPLEASASAPFRLCFRLLEPPENGDRWKIEYLLQSRKDLSLLVPAEQAWIGDL